MRYPSIDYLEPDSPAEVCSLLARYGDDAHVLGGGQSLVPMMHLGLLQPHYLVSLAGIAGLADVQPGPDGGLRIGAMATHRQVAESPVVGERCGILAEAVKLVGSQAVRNVGTVGGDVCHNQVGSDPGAVLLCLNAEAVIAGPEGERSLPFSEFFANYFETSLRPGEILTRIDIPALPDRAGAAYHKLRRRMSDFAIVGVCAVVALDPGDGTCTDARLGLNGVAPVPVRASKAESVLRGQRLSGETIRAAAAAATAELSPLTDTMASAGYRRAMVEVFVQRSLEEAVTRASAN